MRLIGPTLLLALATASPLWAQRIDDARVAVRLASNEMMPVHRTAVAVAPSRTSASTGSMIVGGLIAGVLGTFAGAAVGVSAENCQRGGSDDFDFCGLAGGLIGGLIGEAVGVPIGVNWVANGQGTLGKSIPASLGVSAVCLVAGFATGGMSLLMIPPLQIYTAIRAERTGKAGFLAW
jgi:hypothetical protein